MTVSRIPSWLMPGMSVQVAVDEAWVVEFLVKGAFESDEYLMNLSLKDQSSGGSRLGLDVPTRDVGLSISTSDFARVKVPAAPCWLFTWPRTGDLRSAGELRGVVQGLPFRRDQ